jgi:hypothetical protein
VRRFEEGQLGWFIIKALAVVVAVTVVGLLLDGLGVSFGGYVVLAAFFVFVIVVYLLPLLPTKR